MGEILKMKKIFKVILSMVLILVITVSSLTASAIVTSYGGTLAVLPGNTRSSSPVYNYGWLDNLVVRDDAMAVTSATLKPRPTDYQGSHTCDEFVREVEQYQVLFALDEKTYAAVYDEISKAMYYAVTAMGMTDEYDFMRRYIEKRGIRVSGNEDADDKMYIAVVYAAIRYDAVYTLYNKKVTFPEGISVEGAMVIILAALTDTMLPSDVETFTGLALLVMKNYVEEFEDLPLSSSPDEAEIFHWMKALTASAQDYKVPIVPYNEATLAQKQYVDYAYYASILATVYEVNVDPIYLVLAIQSEEEYSLQKFILKTMLDQKAVDYAEDATIEELFSLAVENGWFALEDEFYSDIMNYEIEVAPSCKKVWFTPFTLADQLEGGSNIHLRIKLNGKTVTPSSTTAVELNGTTESESVRLALYYDDKEGRKEQAVYNFLIVKNPALENDAPASENDMVAQLESYDDRIIPVDNDKVSEVVGEVFSNIDDKVSPSKSPNEDLLTTYGVDQTTYAIEVTEDEDMTVLADPTDRFDFDYLEDLIEGAYETDADGNIVVTTMFDMEAYKDPDAPESVVEKVTEAVKENPEIVVAPTSLMAVGSFAGYMLSKKHRGNEILDEETEYSDDE